MRAYRFFPKNQKSINYIQNSAEMFYLREEDEPEIFFQLQKVLRVKQGDRIIFAIQKNAPPFFDYHFIVQNLQSKEFILSFEQKMENNNELEFSLKLILSLPNKPDKLAFILQKAAELGVDKIILVRADFSNFKHSLKLDRLNKIVVEASEQSQRARIPEVVFNGKLNDFLESHQKKEKDSLIVAMEKLSVNESIDNKPDNIFNTIDKKHGLSILIGPEGGFSDAEKRRIAGLKLPCFSLGKRILRMETAAILSLGLATI